MSNLQHKITELLNGPMKGQGWCSPEKGYDLAMAVIKTNAKTVVEIGVFLGGSLIPMAMACREKKSGIVYAIDPWSNAAAIEGYDGVNAEWWGSKVDMEAIYGRFISNIASHGVSEFVRVVRKKSDDAEIPGEIDVLNIDGQHTDQATRDVEKFASRVRVGGFCYMDDIDGWGGAPARAADKLESMGFVKLFNRDTGAMFERKSIPGIKRRPGRPKKIKS